MQILYHSIFQFRFDSIIARESRKQVSFPTSSYRHVSLVSRILIKIISDKQLYWRYISIIMLYNLWFTA